MSIKIRNKENKTYLIFGNPRSATSFVAKALWDAGVDIKHNDKNQFQDAGVTRINDKIIKDAGGRWTNPPPQAEIDKIDLTEKIKKFIKKKRVGKFWGIKDPRLSLTAHKWTPHLEGDVYMICCFRKPDKVVESSQMDRGKYDRKLVDYYNRNIIKRIKEFCEL